MILQNAHTLGRERSWSMQIKPFHLEPNQQRSTTPAHSLPAIASYYYIIVTTYCEPIHILMVAPLQT